MHLMSSSVMADKAGGGLEPLNDCQTVVCFLYNSILNEKEENNGSQIWEKAYKIDQKKETGKKCRHQTQIKH